MMIDADGFTRVNLEWTIEGKAGVKSGTLYELHSSEVEGAKLSLKQRARKGDTITVKLV